MADYFAVTVCVWPDLVWCYVEHLDEYADRSDDYTLLALPVPDDLPPDTDIDDWVDAQVTADAALPAPGRFDDLLGLRSLLDDLRQLWALVKGK